MTTSKRLITIRSAVPDDAVLLRELRFEALVSYPAAFAADYSYTEAQSVEFLAERMAGPAPGRGSVMGLSACPVVGLICQRDANDASHG